MAGKKKSVNRKKSGKKAASTNPWILHVKQYQQDHPGLSYKEAMKKARASYYH